MLPRPLRDALLLEACKRYSGEHVFVAVLEVEDLLFIKVREKLPADALSARERIVARHVAEGLTYKEIAARLDISPATVRNHIQAIYRRLGIHSNAELATQLLTAEA